jgi:hypothetical protein
MIRTTNGQKWREIYIKITSGESRTSTTTVTDSSLTYAMKNGYFYEVDLWATFYSASATPGLKYTVTLPTHTSVMGWLKTLSTSGGVTTSLYITNANITNATDINPNASLGAFLRLQGSVMPTADSSFTLGFAQATSNGTATSLTLNSYLHIIERFP